jgi:hypothetical protein
MYTIAAGAALLMAVGAWAAPAKVTAVTPLATFTGSVADEAKQGTAPSVLVDPYALQDLWKDWAIADKLPDVDFAKQIVVQSTTRGSVLNLMLSVDDKANLLLGGMSTKDLRPGFRFVVAIVSREGVTSVNGTPLPATRRLAPTAEFRGSNDNAELLKDAPAIIGTPVAFAKLWAKWKIADKQPEIDFAKQFVVVNTTVGSLMSTNFMLDDKGNMQNLGMATMDFREGFRYTISVLNRDGVKTVDGKAVPAPAPAG